VLYNSNIIYTKKDIYLVINMSEQVTDVEIQEKEKTKVTEEEYTYACSCSD